MVDWDSMDRAWTQTRGGAFETLSQAFSFLLTPKSLTEYFKNLIERFKDSTACFETNARPSLLINGHIKNFL